MSADDAPDEGGPPPPPPPLPATPDAGLELIAALSKELSSGSYDCSVCAEPISRTAARWCCRDGCWGVFHLACVQRWAAAQLEERRRALSQASTYVDPEAGAGAGPQFRCPLCQRLQPAASTRAYRCWCGKAAAPAADPSLVPGSCGETCGRRQADARCPHPCTLMCHPGPCPPCGRSRRQECYCGRASKLVGCSSGSDGYGCGETCGRLLDCGNHRCAAPCHPGPCAVCCVMVPVSCYCGATTRRRACAHAADGVSCGAPCGRLRDCGRHLCGRECHPGPCEECRRTPARVRFCPCGKTRVAGPPRTQCTDPIPSCGLPCELPLACGHLCWRVCHDEEEEGPCGPCRELVSAQCPCGAKTLTFPCFCASLPQEEWPAAAEAAGVSAALLPAAFPPTCHTPCRAMLSCGKHRCARVCCTDRDHLCVQLCSKKLSCGAHRCGQLCHAGPCPPCANTSYEPLYCRCGKTWIDPPVPCGTPPPPCSEPCPVPRPCGHPPHHHCHPAEEACPPCTVPCEKRCASHDAKMPYHMPCHLTTVLCGKRCGKALPCCKKTCQLTCHAGPCTHVCVKKSFAEVLKERGKS